MGYARNLEKTTNVLTPVPQLYSIGEVAGTSSLDYNNGYLQSGNITGSLYFNVPLNGSDGKSLELWLTASGSNRTVNITSSVLRPSNSSTIWPITLTSGLTTHFKFHYFDGKWVLSSMVGEYSI